MKNKIFLILTILACLFFQSCDSTNLQDENKQNPKEKNKTEISTTKRVVILNDGDIKDIRSRLNDFEQVIKSADKNLNYTPSPVEVFAPDPHYDSSGVNQSANDGKILARDFRMAYIFALSYILTEDKKYAIAAQNIINAWANTLKSIGTRQGKAGINFRSPYLITAATWVKDVNNWDHSSFDSLLKNVILPNSSRESNQNHGLWATFMEATAAVYLNDMAKLKSAKNRWEEILEGAVIEDGSMPMEVERSGTSNWRGGPDKGKKGISYTHYALLPASMAAKIFADNGIPTWNSKGGKLLQKAFNKAAEWTLNPETFPYYESNNGELLDVRNAAYFSLLVRYFPNQKAKEVLAQGKVGMNGFYLLEIFR